MTTTRGAGLDASDVAAGTRLGRPVGRDPGGRSRRRRHGRSDPPRPLRPTRPLGRHPFPAGARRVAPRAPRLRLLCHPCGERARRCRMAGLEQPVRRGTGHHREELLGPRCHRPAGRGRRPPRAHRVGPAGPGRRGQGHERAPQRSPGVHRGPATGRCFAVTRRTDGGHHGGIRRRLQQDGAGGRCGRRRPSANSPPRLSPSR